MEPDMLERILDGREKPTNLSLALLKNITLNFSKEREIGHGGFATVYKGVLSNGNVAVKRIMNNHTIDERLFYREVDSLMAINHQNIVRFVGFCASTDQIAIKTEGSREHIYAEIRERLLCFEYISNGSLQNYITDELRGLDWSTRYRLIKGICDGLHYLHMEKHIYHMDLKPANILLDKDMVPKITDFGLSRLDEKSKTMSVDRRGTLGYCAPEYLQRGNMSFKLDIYSLGIIIIELVTGEKSIPGNSKNNVLRKWSHRWKKAGEESTLCYEQVTKCIDIGLLCQEIDPWKRPSISEIIRDISKMECTTGEISVGANESTFGPADCEIQKGPHENLQSFLDTIDPLFSSNSSYSSSDRMLSHVDGVLFKALVKTEGVFQNQLSQCSKSVEPDRIFDCLLSMLQPSSESRSEGGKHASAGAQSDNQEAAVYSPPALIEPKFVPLLAKLAQQWVQAGFQQECAEIYSEARASALESSLKNLGVEKLSKDEVQKMPWEILESKIGKWIHFMRIAVKLLFAGERQLCDQVFECNQSLRAESFSAITKNSLATLVSFGEAVAMRKISPEKLFLLLDMYEIMCELQTEIDTIFVGESCSQMHDSVLSLTQCLAQTAQKTLSDFEEAVEKDATETIHTDGTVHPLTSYVINYVKVLFDYQSTLKQLFQESKREDGTDSERASVTISIMQALQNNLDFKAKQYKDTALMHIFLMNNIHHIVKSVDRPDAEDLLGDEWIQTHRRIVLQNANQYKRVAWAKVVQCISVQDFPSRTAMKERLRSFNVLFEEIYQKQCGWSVPDSELRESLRLTVAEIMLSAYRSFQLWFSYEMKDSKAAGKYIKHTPEQLELLLGDLFEGKQGRA